MRIKGKVRIWDFTLSEMALSLPDGRKGQSGSRERGAGREMNVTLCTGECGI
jgi:hypothetical protein